MTVLSTVHRSRLNGVVDTSKNVMANIENIANSAQCWVTYDITQGKWSVVINQAGTSTHSFDDSNIVGEVDLVTTQLDRLYNAVEVQYPDNDLEDSNSFVRAEMLPADLLQNEPENVLRLTYPLLSEQIQALNLGLTELKQSRLDKVITFVSDYTAYGIRAGDIIDVTIDTYNWTSKLFRVLQLEEVDRADGYIDIRITANEYDDNIYTHDLSRFTLSNEDGIFGLGDIGAMDALTVTLTEADQLPHILIESAFNTAGAPVTGVEIWTYNVTDPAEIANWNNPALYPDDERNYRLLTTKFSVDETFALGADFEHTIYDLGPGNWLIKIRPINAQTTGPFTTPGALTTYAPSVVDGIVPGLSQNDLFSYTMVGFKNINVQTINQSGSGFTTTLSGSHTMEFDTDFIWLDGSFGYSSGGANASNTGYVQITLNRNGTTFVNDNGVTNLKYYTNNSDGTIAFNTGYSNVGLVSGDTLGYTVVISSSYAANSVEGNIWLKSLAGAITLT